MTLRASRSRLLQHWAVQGAAVTMAALTIEYGAQFARSVVLTHFLDRTQFGIAAAMAATLTLVDMSTGLGADRYLVQARDGGSEAALAAAHTLTLGRGVLSGALLVVLATPIATLLGISGYTTDFECLGIIPIVRGFEHLRLSQIQRQNRFVESAFATSCANTAGLLAVLTASVLTRDCRAVPVGLGLQASALVLATHVAARRRYKLSFSRQALDRALVFGMPLMVNGLALAAVAQCDRLAVGHFLGVVPLGHYTVAAMTFYLPTSLLLRLLVSVAQPRLSAAWHTSPSGDFKHMLGRMNGLVAAVAAGFALTIGLEGNLVLKTLFGADYVVTDAFLYVYSLFVFVRFAKTGVNFAGLATGRTKDLMLSNLPGIGALLLACLLLSAWPSLVVAASTSLLGEVIGTAVACYRLRSAIDVGAFARPFLFAALLPVLSAVWVVLADPSREVRLAAVAGMLGLACLAVVAERFCRNLRSPATWLPALKLNSSRLK